MLNLDDASLKTGHLIDRAVAKCHGPANSDTSARLYSCGRRLTTGNRLIDGKTNGIGPIRRSSVRC